MPKTISSLPTGAINRTDNLITAPDGSDELKRNTVDELLAEPTAEIEALQTENAELKAQIAEMEEEISELNSDLSDLIVTQSFTAEAQTLEANGYTDFVINVALTGYTPLGVLLTRLAGSYSGRYSAVGNSYLSGNTLTQTIHNCDQSASYDWSLVIVVLYQKS